MNKPIAILFNARAGRGQAKKILLEIVHSLERYGKPHAVFKDHWPAEFSAFSSVWIIGGDGTLNYFINRARQPLPPLALFKGGTGNDFATHLYGNANTSEMVDIILHASPKPVDAGLCNETIFLNTIGIGFDGAVLRHMRAIRILGSFLGYYAAIIRNIFTYREPVYSITVDGGEKETSRWLLLELSNAPTTGGGFRVSPLARTNDGLLNLVACKPLGIWRRLQALINVRTGRHLALPSVTHLEVKSIRITSDTVVDAQADGELISASSFNCSVLPGHFRFLY